MGIENGLGGKRGNEETIADRTLLWTAIAASFAAVIIIEIGDSDPVVSLVVLLCAFLALISMSVLWLRTRGGRLVGGWYLIRRD